MNINIPSEGIIGLYLSGGVESSLLLYLLAKKRINVRCYTIVQSNVCMNRIHNILNWVNENTRSEISFIEEIHDKNPTSDRTFVRWILLYLRTEEVDNFVIGSNKFMPHLPERKFFEHKKVLIPFKNLYKNEIVQIYRKENIWELFQLTHSCYIQKHGHCGSCLNCIERNWAINYKQIFN